MANSKTVENGKKSESEEEKGLQTQLEKLQNEISSITSSLADLGADKLGTAKDETKKLYHSMKENGEEMVSQTKENINNFGEALDRCVRKNPSKSVLFAAGFGFILAQLLRH
ncbi:DUF883 family protein [Bartonella sp. CB189]|uniref:DUF883 family protein n=1 Tax=Bartonella sp. CB189 TaxID=3112254 RepID=UPI002F96B566